MWRDGDVEEEEASVEGWRRGRGGSECGGMEAWKRRKRVWEEGAKRVKWSHEHHTERNWTALADDEEGQQRRCGAW